MSFHRAWSIAACVVIWASSLTHVRAEVAHDGQPWYPTMETWDLPNAIIISPPTSGTVLRDALGGIVYRNDDASVPFDTFRIAMSSDNIAAILEVTVDKNSSTLLYDFKGITKPPSSQPTTNPPNSQPTTNPTSSPSVGDPIDVPAPALPDVVHGTVVGLPGNAPIPSNGTIQIFVSDQTVEGDASDIWWDVGGTVHSGVTDWGDIRDGLFFLDNDSVDVLILSGHGSGLGGIATSGPDLTAANLDVGVISVIKGRTSDSAVIVILGCDQADPIFIQSIQDLANETGLPVIVNDGRVNSGTNGAGIWIKVSPQE